MKKIVSILLSLTLLMGLGVLTACSGTTDETTAGITTTQREITTIDETTVDESEDETDESMTGNVELTTDKDESSTIDESLTTEG